MWEYGCNALYSPALGTGTEVTYPVLSEIWCFEKKNEGKQLTTKVLTFLTFAFGLRVRCSYCTNQTGVMQG